MRPLKILCVVGTRPEAIKMAPIIQELRRNRSDFECVVVSTGQHREMLDQMLAMFDLRPDVDLGIMQPNQTLAALTAELFARLDPVVAESQPDWLLAQGDTTSVMVASLVAFYRRIRFGHVEAGLRTGDFSQPFPEELNRRVADLTADACFAPTERARNALLAEGVAPERVHVTGNTVVDALEQIVQSGRLENVELPRGASEARRLVLITAHRRESFGEPFRDLCLALGDLARAHEEVQFWYPVHLNPNVRTPVNEILQGIANVHLVEPVGYTELLALMQKAELVLTDSGGIQEEAPSFGVPVLVMRKTTERPEGVECGLAELVGTDRATIFRAADELLRRQGDRRPATNPYGDGKAAQKIAAVLKSVAQ